MGAERLYKQTLSLHCFTAPTPNPPNALSLCLQALKVSALVTSSLHSLVKALLCTGKHLIQFTCFSGSSAFVRVSCRASQGPPKGQENLFLPCRWKAVNLCQSCRATSNHLIWGIHGTRSVSPGCTPEHVK